MKAFSRFAAMVTSPSAIEVDAADDLTQAAVEVESGKSPGLSLRAYLSGSRAIAVAIGVTILGIFLPTLTVAFAFTDDYPVLAITNGLGPSAWFGESIVNTTASGGRPFAGLLDQLVFSTAGTIDNLRFVRMIGVIGILALALLLHWALVRAGISRVPAALIAVLVCSMPAFQVYASWAVLFNVPYAALLGGGASLLAASAVHGPRHLRLDRHVGATAMLLGALLIYQPTAMFFWVFLAVALVGSARESERAKNLVRTHFGVAAAAIALAFLVQRLALHVVGNTVPNKARNELTHDVVGKARWFVEEPLYKSLNLFDLTPSLWLAGTVAAVTTVGILLLLRRRCASPLLYLGVGVLLIPLSYLPNLVVKESFPSYRSQGSLSSLIAIYFCLGALGIWLSIPDGFRRPATERLALMGATTFVAASAFLAAKNVTTLFVEPQSTELRMIRSQVAALPTGVSRVGFVGTAYYWGLTKLVIIDEFGLPSTSQLWTLEPSVLLVLREEGRLPREGPRPEVDIIRYDTYPLPTDEPVIDVRGLRELR
jgi:hypothetical protein